jgi:hypothetical protein
MELALTRELIPTEFAYAMFWCQDHDYGFQIYYLNGDCFDEHEHWNFEGNDLIFHNYRFDNLPQRYWFHFKDATTAVHFKLAFG